jgi:molecular chaperone HtpG
VLSTFMISDHVQVLTCHPEEQEAREITLESVHGQYLMRLLPKSSHEIPPSIKSHGTIIRLRVRKSAELEDVKRILESWIVVPACPVFYEDGDGAVERVGYTTAVEALESAVAEYLNDQEGSLRQANLAVRSFHRDGLELAYVVKWNPWFREYSLMTRPETDLFSYNSVMSRTRLRRNPRVDEDTRSATGTLIEGVRVTSQSPAMKNSLGMWALANATGQSAPRTNVARTALESGPELDDFAKSVYDGYVDHVKNEVVALQEERGFSLTRAIFEAPFIAAALVEPRVIDSALSGSAYREALRQLPVYALEDEDGRRAASCEDVLALEEFATVDDEIVESVDFLLSSLPRSVTMREMFEFVGLPTTTMPSTPILRLSRQSADPGGRGHLPKGH